MPLMSYRSLPLAGLTVAAAAGCGGLTMESGWRDREIVIDGEIADWTDH